MRSATRLALGAAVAAGLGVVVATIWVGSLVKEETVVANPYEEGLRHDAERRARAALGWEVRGLAPPASPGRSTLQFEVVDGAGRPLDGAAVAVGVSRPDTSRGATGSEARGTGPGRWAAEVDLPAAGPWRLTFDVRRGGDRVRIERVVDVAPACDAGASPCARPLPGGGQVVLDLGPRPLRTMREIEVRVEVRPPGRAAERRVSVSFEMAGMKMGENRVALAPAGPGRFAGKAVLVRCPSGRKDWVAEVEVSAPGQAPRTVRFELAVER
ncbi:MAG TPA: FixH family protein [Anaeromyxobacteraceae bacterium]|nr:FixH family protein [Anaeromyxobacteraceae bacterium]